jgi:chromosome segregation ATPase
MDVLPTLINAVVVAAAATLVTFVTRSQHQDLVHRLDRHEDKNDAQFAKIDQRFDAVDERFDAVRSGLEAKIDGLRSDLETKIDGLRSDITQLAFRLSDHPHPQTG